MVEHLVKKMFIESDCIFTPFRGVCLSVIIFVKFKVSQKGVLSTLVFAITEQNKYKLFVCLSKTMGKGICGVYRKSKDPDQLMKPH